MQLDRPSDLPVFEDKEVVEDDVPICGDHSFDVYSGINCPTLVNLYAMVGLHHHNMVKGTNLQLERVEKYIMYGWPFCASYDLTLIAFDPVSCSPVRFQTFAEETQCVTFNVTCNVPRVENPENEPVIELGCKPLDTMPLPEWPNTFADKDLFYELQRSEWEANDWIRLYLELAFVATHQLRRLSHPDLSTLKILNVVVETAEGPPNASVLERFTSAVFYITYDRDLGDDGVCKRRAIVRRTVDPISKCYCLKGKNFKDSTTRVKPSTYPPNCGHILFGEGESESDD